MLFTDILTIKTRMARVLFSDYTTIKYLKCKNTLLQYLKYVTSVY